MFALLLTWLALSRFGMDYNDSGRYYDPEVGVVYHEQAMEVFGCFAIAGWLGFLLAVLACVRLGSSSRPDHASHQSFENMDTG